MNPRRDNNIIIGRRKQASSSLVEKKGLLNGRTYMPTTHIRRHRTIIRFAPETIRNEAITNDFSKSFVPRTRRSGTHDSPHTLWTEEQKKKKS